MNSYIIGFALAILVTILPIFFMSKNHGIYASLEGFVVVGGGTLAIMLASYPFQKVKLFFRVVFVVLRRESDEASLIAREVVEIARDTRGERALLAGVLDKVRYPFLRDGMELILNRLDDDLEDLLHDRILTKRQEDESMVNMVKSLSRFPPALGLLATVISLVTLLEGLGGGKTGMENLGPSMAVGLVGTLYGIVLANMVFSPIAENLAMKSALETRNRQIAMAGLLLLAEKKSSLLVQESMNSLLPPSKRVDVLGMGRPGAAEAA